MDVGRVKGLMNRETAETSGEKEIGFSEPISLRIPSRPEYVLLARLVVSQVGQVAGFEPEDVYDLKLAVTEAATNVIRHASVEHFEIEYRVSPGMVEITVADAGGGFEVDNLTHAPNEHGGFGLSVIRNLVDDVKLDSMSGGGTRLTMIRRAAAPV
jgi:serine/threonine-protein kinase RsbW